MSRPQASAVYVDTVYVDVAPGVQSVAREAWHARAHNPESACGATGGAPTTASFGCNHC